MKLDFQPDQVRVRTSGSFRLAECPTNLPKLYRSKRDYAARLEEYTRELSAIQQRLYADGRYAVLLIFQGMDAAGKDGAIRHVFSGVNPQGCQVFSFKQPSSEELDHDFLWRVHKRMPERGRIGIFNRSYYEEVLIVRAEPSVLAAQRLPDELRERPKLWRERQRDIRQFEDFLFRNGTRILKFFLHISQEEQRLRFLKRIDDPDRNWKLSPSDLMVRKRWDAYQKVYDDCLRRTTSKHAPWFVIPADDKQNARLMLSHIIVESLGRIPASYPKVGEEHRARLQEIRQQLGSDH